jgi:hypothetical protein
MLQQNNCRASAYEISIGAEDLGLVRTDIGNGGMAIGVAEENNSFDTINHRRAKLGRGFRNNLSTLAMDVSVGSATRGIKLLVVPVATHHNLSLRALSSSSVCQRCHRCCTCRVASGEKASDISGIIHALKGHFIRAQF